jgi:hypothetical protein
MEAYELLKKARDLDETSTQIAFMASYLGRRVVDVSS